MRAKEFIKEYGGFLAVGPSGVRYPRGYDPSQVIGGMYPSQRTNYSQYNDNYPESTPDYLHVKKIDQRIAGGMPEKDAIKARAQKIGMDFEELAKIYYNYKNKK